MNKYIIGAHNSCTYNKIKQWYLRPIYWSAECLSISLASLYNDYNVRLFDVRIKFIKNRPVIGHGIFLFDTDIYKELNTINSFKDSCYCRIILEFNKLPKDINKQISLFQLFCKEIENVYQNIIFFGGNIKYSWKRVYLFNSKEPSLDDLYSSVQRTKLIDYICPRYYAKLHNKLNYLKGTNKECLFIDFVEIK